MNIKEKALLLLLLFPAAVLACGEESKPKIVLKESYPSAKSVSYDLYIPKEFGKEKFELAFIIVGEQKSPSADFPLATFEIEGNGKSINPDWNGAYHTKISFAKNFENKLSLFLQFRHHGKDGSVRLCSSIYKYTFSELLLSYINAEQSK